MPRFQFWIRVFVLQTLVMTSAVRAADVLNEVPRDALGFAIIRQLDGVEGKSAKVLEALGSAPAGPLALLKSIAGIEAGLDTERDLLVVLLPPENESRPFHLAVWLPVDDYNALVDSLEGDPQRQIAAVTIAGEDLLAVKHGDWAVLMDPDQRDRIEMLRDGIRNATVPPRQTAVWSAWIDANDATVVVLPAGMRTLWALAASEQLFVPPARAQAGEAIAEDDLFGPPNRHRPQLTGWPAMRLWIRNTLGGAPEVARWAAEAEGLAGGVKFDEAGNIVVGVRLALAEDSVARAKDSAEPQELPPNLHAGGEFVLTGSGVVSPRWLVPAVTPYVQSVTNDLASQLGQKPDPADVAKFRQSVEQVASEVRGYSIVVAEGNDAATWTDHFLALSVPSSSEFLHRCGSLMELWNAMLAKTEVGKLLEFAARPVTISGRSGMEYAIDMLAVAGGPALPETKASMEKLFGPGGKFRLQFVPIDDDTVLLAVASEEQVAKVLDRISNPETAGKAGGQKAVSPQLKEVAELVATERDWQIYVSPHGYNEWLRRQMDAILGAVIGGPIVPDFAASPPVGIVGGVEGQIVWVEVAVPANTIRAAGKFWRR